jgi:hypothetical protein
MAKKGIKVERNSVSEQPHGTTAAKVETAKKATGSNQRAKVEKKLDGKK